MRRHLAASGRCRDAPARSRSGHRPRRLPTQAALQAAGTSQSASSDATSNPVQADQHRHLGAHRQPWERRLGLPSNASDTASAAATSPAQRSRRRRDQSGSGAQPPTTAYTGSPGLVGDLAQDHPSNSAISVRIGSPGSGGEVGEASRPTRTRPRRRGRPSRPSSGGAPAPPADAAAAARRPAEKPGPTSLGLERRRLEHSHQATTQYRCGSAARAPTAPSTIPNSSAAVFQQGNLANRAVGRPERQRQRLRLRRRHRIQGRGSVRGPGQLADSSAGATPDDPSNSATWLPDRLAGQQADVHQSNEPFAGSLAGNAAKTEQTADQSQGGWGIQALGPAGRRHVAGRRLRRPPPRSHPSNDVTACTWIAGLRRLGRPVQLVDRAVLRGQPCERGAVGGAVPEGSRSAACGCRAGRGPVRLTGLSADSSATSER